MKSNKTNYNKYFYQISSNAYLLKNLAGKDTKKKEKKKKILWCGTHTTCSYPALQ